MWRRKYQKRKFQKKKFLKFFIIIPVLLIFCLIIFLIFKSGLFNIKNVEIEAKGLTCATESDLKNSSNIVGQNFFLLDFSKIETGLKKKFVCIKSLIISKYFPDKIKIQSINREPLMMLSLLREKEASGSSVLDNIATPSARDISDSFLVDNEGVIFAKSTDSLAIPKIFIQNSTFAVGDRLQNDLMDSLNILEKVKKFGIVPKQSWVIGNNFIIYSETPGQKIIFKLGEGIDIQLASLQLILDKAKIDLIELEFIDLRFDKPVVRYAPKK